MCSIEMEMLPGVLFVITINTLCGKQILFFNQAAKKFALSFKNFFGNLASDHSSQKHAGLLA